jgi:hypothetical protein
MRKEHRTLVGKPEETSVLTSDIQITHNGTVCGLCIGCVHSGAFVKRSNLVALWKPRIIFLTS